MAPGGPRGREATIQRVCTGSPIGARTHYEGRMAPFTVHDLRPGARYRVREAFTDFRGTTFEPGRLLVFRERHYLPYDGGHTLVFDDVRIYLQDDDQAAVLDHLDRYLAAE